MSPDDIEEYYERRQYENDASLALTNQTHFSTDETILRRTICHL